MVHPVRSRAGSKSLTTARDVGRDGLIGAGFGLALGGWLVAINPAIREMMNGPAMAHEALMTALFVVVAQFSVGAVLSGVVLRMFAEGK